jgi:hypothetical protein
VWVERGRGRATYVHSRCCAARATQRLRKSLVQGATRGGDAGPSDGGSDGRGSAWIECCKQLEEEEEWWLLNFINLK